MSECVTNFMEAYLLTKKPGMWGHIKVEIVNGEWQYTVFSKSEVYLDPSKKGIEPQESE